MSDRFVPLVEMREEDNYEPQGIKVQGTEPQKPAANPKFVLPKFDLKKFAPWIMVAALAVFIVWERVEPGPDAGIDVAKPVAEYHETLIESLATSQEALADFCEGRNPDASEIMGQSKKLVSEALRASGAVLGDLDNKYLRDGTPSERAEYLRSLAKELREYK